MKQVYIVEVHYEDQDPVAHGPYTEAQAQRVAARLDDEVRLSSDKHGGNHHPQGVRGASALPLGRYDQFMSADERKQARRAARQAERDLQARLSE